MSAYSMRKPTDWQQFERATCVLVRCVLQDPNTQQNGRQGQPQHGVDIFGLRKSDKRRIGVQCKQRLDGEVTEKELLDELEKAKCFDPAIDEFVLATTARRDEAIQTVARQLTLETQKSSRPMHVAVWGWEDIEEHASHFAEAQKAFDPTFNPFAEDQGQHILRKLDDITARQAHSGILRPHERPTLFFSPKGDGKITTLQIGQSGVFLQGTGGQIGAMLYPILQDSQFKVEIIDGKAKIFTRIKDESGNLIAEIIRNEWKVSPAKSWDRNYSADALEVKDSGGNVVLQVRVLHDRIQLQGAWWWNMGPPNGIMRFWMWNNPSEGVQITVRQKTDPHPPTIPPMFRYPSELHLGEMEE